MVTIVPVRLAMLVVLLAIALLSCAVSALCGRARVGHCHLRTWLFQPAVIAAQASLALCFGYWRVDVTRVVHRTQAVTRRPRILVSNFSSVVDVVYLCATLGCSLVVSTRHPLCVYLPAFVHRAMRNVTFDESDPLSLARAQRIVSRRCTGARRTPRLLFFPEEVPTNGSVVLPFKLHAFTPGQPVQPVVIRHAVSVCDPSTTAGGVPPLVTLCHVMSQPWNRMEVTWLAPVIPRGAHLVHAAAFAEHVRGLMAARLGAEVSGCCSVDARLARRAVVCGVDSLPFVIGSQHALTAVGVGDAFVMAVFDALVQVRLNDSGHPQRTLHFDTFQAVVSAVVVAPLEHRSPIAPSLLLRLWNAMGVASPTASFRDVVIGAGVVASWCATGVSMRSVASARGVRHAGHTHGTHSHIASSRCRCILFDLLRRGRKGLVPSSTIHAAVCAAAAAEAGSPTAAPSMSRAFGLVVGVDGVSRDCFLRGCAMYPSVQHWVLQGEQV